MHFFCGYNHSGLDLQLTVMKFALTLVVIAAVVLPCMLAFNIDRRPEKDVLRKWLEEQMVHPHTTGDAASGMQIH